MATHSSILAWEIPWTEKPGGLQSMGSQRVRCDWATERTQSKDTQLDHKGKDRQFGGMHAWASLFFLPFMRGHKDLTVFPCPPLPHPPTTHWPPAKEMQSRACNISAQESPLRDFMPKVDLVSSQRWASLVAQLVKNLPTMRETWVRSLGWEDPLEKGKATHSSILAWRIPWTIQSMGSQRVGHDWATSTQKKKRSPNSWASNYIAPVYDGAFLHFLL